MDKRNKVLIAILLMLATARSFAQQNIASNTSGCGGTAYITGSSTQIVRINGQTITNTSGGADASAAIREALAGFSSISNSFSSIREESQFSAAEIVSQIEKLDDQLAAVQEQTAKLAEQYREQYAAAYADRRLTRAECAKLQRMALETQKLQYKSMRLKNQKLSLERQLV